jgi:hypothetical protein
MKGSKLKVIIHPVKYEQDLCPPCQNLDVNNVWGNKKLS